MTESVKEKYPAVSMPDRNLGKVLKGQKALVTGANSGIGKGVALALGQAGAEVMVNYVSHQDAAEEVAQTISGYGSRSSTFHCDVSQKTRSRRCSSRCARNLAPSISSSTTPVCSAMRPLTR